MKITIITPRLLIRPIVEEDVDGFFELDSNPKVHLYLGNRPVQSREESLNMIHYIQQQYSDNGIGRMSVIEKETQKFVGWTGLKLITDTVNNHTNFYDLGYRFIERVWSQGYATESALAVLRFAFTDFALENVYAIADCNNLASDKILRKIGLKKLETFDYDGTPHGWYKITRQDWENK